MQQTRIMDSEYFSLLHLRKITDYEVRLYLKSIILNKNIKIFDSWRLKLSISMLSRQSNIDEKQYNHLSPCRVNLPYCLLE